MSSTVIKKQQQNLVLNFKQESNICSKDYNLNFFWLHSLLLLVLLRPQFKQN